MSFLVAGDPNGIITAPTGTECYDITVNGLRLWQQTKIPSGGSWRVIKTGLNAIITQGAATWGLIGGTLSAQTDLVTALGAKLDKTLPSGKIFVGDSSDVAAGVTLTLNNAGGTFGLSNTGVLTFPDASGTTRGLLTSTDWTTFNNKQSALTFGNLTEATSGVLTITGGTGAVIGSGTTIQVKQAATGQSGYLSNTDWNTFNGKVGGSGPTNRIAYWSGSSAIGAVGAITAGHIMYADANGLPTFDATASRNFYWDSTNHSLILGGTSGAGSGNLFYIPVSSVGAASANYGIVSLGSGNFTGAGVGKFVGNSSGTWIAINTSAGFAGNLIDCQIAGVSNFTVASQLNGTATYSVGIGTNTPAARLHIVSAGLGAANRAITHFGNHTNGFAADHAIGISDANGIMISKLAVDNNTVSNRAIFLARDDTNGHSIQVYNSSGTVTAKLSSNGLLLNTTSFIGSEKLRVNGTSYFDDAITMKTGAHFIFDTSGTGTKIGTATNQKLAFYGQTPATQYSTTGTTNGFSAGAGSAVDDAATFTGDTGSTAYTIGDIVRAMKLLGLIAS